MSTHPEDSLIPVEIQKPSEDRIFTDIGKLPLEGTAVSTNKLIWPEVNHQNISNADRTFTDIGRLRLEGETEEAYKVRMTTRCVT